MGVDLGQVARAILDANSYMTLATADASGRPWASPVYYAAASYGELLWVSVPEAQHSRNVAARPEVGIVIFDSTVAIGTGQAVYLSATAEELTGAELERGIEAFSRGSEASGAKRWSMDDVRPPGHLRLYRALVSEHYVLDPDAPVDRRVRVTP